MTRSFAPHGAKERVFSNIAEGAFDGPELDINAGK
jgi:hypothetical protein